MPPRTPEREESLRIMPHLHVIHVLLSGNDSCQLREDARDVFGYRSLRQQLLLSGIFVPQATFVY